MADEKADPVGGELETGETLDDRLLAFSETLIRYTEVIAAVVLGCCSRSACSTSRSRSFRARSAAPSPTR